MLATVGGRSLGDMSEHLGDRLARLRRLADLTQEGLAERSSVSVDVVRKLEQKRKHSARLPTLHALSEGLGVELTALLGDPPGVPSNGEADPPQLVAVRRAIMPPLFAPPPEPSGAEKLSLPLLRREISDGWTLYHDAEFGRLMDVLPGIIADARFAAAVGTADERAAGQAALGKALQLAGHLAIRLGKIDLALSALERAMHAALDSSPWCRRGHRTDAPSMAAASGALRGARAALLDPPYRCPSSGTGLRPRLPEQGR